MMSREECLAKAHHCEHMARDCQNRIDRRILLVTAEHWRTLAKEAGDLERDRDAELPFAAPRDRRGGPG